MDINCLFNEMSKILKEEHNTSTEILDKQFKKFIKDNYDEIQIIIENSYKLIIDEFLTSLY